MPTPTPRFVWATWIVTRLLICGAWLPMVASGPNDVLYYFERIQLLARFGPGWTLLEYPTPVIWLLYIPYLLGFGTYLGYLVVFAASMLVLDFAFARRLWQVGGTFAGWAVLCWTFALGLLGPTPYLRFDLLTTVLAGWALLSIAERRDGLAASLTALGAALKLWPALLWPALLIGDKRRNWRTTAIFWTTGAALAVASLAWGGWARLFTPLQWQANRGQQVEAVFSTVPMLARLADPSSYSVYLTTWQAFEIFGPGVEGWQRATTVATVVGVVLVAAFYLAWLTRGRRCITQAALLMVFVVILMIVTNKTFSPQYLLWASAPLAVAVVGLSDAPESTRAVRRLAIAVLALTAATLIVYPMGYDHLVGFTPGTPAITVVLAARNLAVVVVLVLLGRHIHTFSTALWRRRAAA